MLDQRPEAEARHRLRHQPPCALSTRNFPPLPPAALLDGGFTPKDLEKGAVQQINKALADAPAHVRAMALQVVGLSDATAKKAL